MNFLETIKSIGRKVLPEPVEKVFGIYKEEPVLDFKFGEGLNTEQRAKANEILQKPSFEPVEIGFFGSQKYITRPKGDLIGKALEGWRIFETPYQRISETKELLVKKGLDEETSEKIAISKEVQKKSPYFQLATDKSPEDYKKLTPEMREALLTLDTRRGFELAIEVLPLPVGKIKPVKEPVKKLAKEVVEEAAEVLPKYAININLGKLKTAGDVKNTINNISKIFKGSINEARRGIITYQETQKLADDLGLTTSKLLKTRKGAAFNAEEALAARQLLVNSAEEVWALGKKAIGGATKDLVNFKTTLNRHKEIQEAVSGVAAEVGRALSSFNIPAGTIGQKAKVLEEALKRLGGRDLTEAMSKKLMSIDPSDTISLNKFLRDITKAKTSDKVYEYWINSILSAPSTHQVNAISNTLVKLSTIPEKSIAAGLDFTFSLGGKLRPRERFFGEVGADIFGMYKGLTTGLERAIYAFTNELPKLERAGAIKLETKVRQAIKGKLGRVVRLPGRFLVAADEFFKGINYMSEIYTLAYRQSRKEGIKGTQNAAKRIAEIVANPTEKIVEKAEAEMLYRTFTQELGSIGKALMYVRDKIPFMRYVIPFLRTPINIAKFGLERTPLNFLRIGAKQLKKETRLKGEKLTGELAKATMGSLMGLGTFLLAKEDKITGAAPRDKAERDAFYREGKLPYAIKIGNKYYSYARLEPLATIIGFTADAVKIIDDLPELEGNELLGRIAFSFSENLLNKTFMKGLSDVMMAISDPERYGQFYIQGYAGSWIPNAVAWLGRGIDPYFRKSSNLLDTIKSRIPELSKDVIPSRGVFGEPAEREGGLIWKLGTPIYVSEIKEDKVENELKRLDITIGFPDKKISQVKLNPKQYDEFLKATGRVSKAYLSKLIDLPNYKSLSDVEKKKQIEAVIRDIREEVREMFLPEIVKDNLDIELPEYISNEQFLAIIKELYDIEDFVQAPDEKKREIILNLLNKALTR